MAARAVQCFSHIDSAILSSRASREAAGWGCTSWADPSTEYEEGTARPGIKRRQFSWISPKPLWEPRNYKIARWLGDSTIETALESAEFTGNEMVGIGLQVTVPF